MPTAIEIILSEGQSGGGDEPAQGTAPAAPPLESTAPAAPPAGESRVPATPTPAPSESPPSTRPPEPEQSAPREPKPSTRPAPPAPPKAGASIDPVKALQDLGLPGLGALTAAVSKMATVADLMSVAGRSGVGQSGESSVTVTQPPRTETRGEGETGRDEGATELPEDAPKREDFRDLTGVLSDVARRWSPQSIMAAIRSALADRPEPVRERVETTETTDRTEVRTRDERASSETTRERTERTQSTTSTERSEQSQATVTTDRSESRERSETSRRSEETARETTRETTQERTDRTERSERQDTSTQSSEPPERTEPQTAVGRGAAGIADAVSRLENFTADLFSRATGAAGRSAELARGGVRSIRSDADEIARALGRTLRDSGIGRAARAGAARVTSGARAAGSHVATASREVAAEIASTRVGRASISAGQQAGQFFGSAARAAAGTRVGQMAAGGGRAVGGAASRVAARVGIGTAARAAGGAATAATGAGAAAAGAGAAAGGTAAAGGAGATLAAAALNPVTIGAAAAGAALLGTAVAAKKVVDAFGSAADSIADVSPEVAAARAETDADLERTRIDRAEQIGPRVAQVEAARGRLQEAMYGLGTDIYDILARLAPQVEKGVDGITLTIEAIRLFKESFENGLAQIPRNPLGLDRQREEREVTEALGRFAIALNEFNRNGPPDDLDGMDPDLAAVLKLDGRGGRDDDGDDPLPPNEDI